VAVAQQPAADAQDHRAVALQKRLEGRLVTTGPEAFQPLPVRHSDVVLDEGNLSQVLDDAAEWARRHVARSVVLDRLSLLTKRAKSGGRADDFRESLRPFFLRSAALVGDSVLRAPPVIVGLARLSQCGSPPWPTRRR
jgi:hypothetical protein